MSQSTSVSKNILLIEDNPGDARLIMEMVSDINQLYAEGEPFHVIWKSTLKDGLDVLRSAKVSVILLDLSLPDSQGFETFRRTHEEALRTPVILLTGLSDDKLATVALRSGAQDYLQKTGLTAFFLERAMRYATERKFLEKELKQLSQRILEIREEERSALSQEIHDGLGQSLLALKLQLQSKLAKIEKQVGTPITAQTGEIIEYLDEILQEVRTLSHNLSPIGLKGLGIARAILQLAERLSHTGGPEIVTEVAAIDNFFPENWDINVYRIVEQALVNAVKHAAANRIEIAAKLTAESLIISVSDDGKGMDIEALHSGPNRRNGLGLHIMKERAQIAGGVLQIVSEPGKGSRIQMEIPRLR